MIKLTAIIAKHGADTLFTKYPENMFFADQDGILKYEGHLREKWGAVFGCDVSILLNYRERPSKIVSPMEIFLETAKVMGFKNPQSIFNKSQGQDVSKPRRYATTICYDLNYSQPEIENGTPLKNRIGYYYVNKVKSELLSEPVRLEYEDIKNRVIQNLYT